MDEPLFKHFGSDKMIPLIKLLGMKESESIEHSYVTESITKGQKKIADKVIVEQSANSQGEWMERNLGPPVP
jgi:preprotein translocase subunit SecA